jgi:hypothetical protein
MFDATRALSHVLVVISNAEPFLGDNYRSPLNEGIDVTARLLLEYLPLAGNPVVFVGFDAAAGEVGVVDPLNVEEEF